MRPSQLTVVQFHERNGSWLEITLQRWKKNKTAEASKKEKEKEKKREKQKRRKLFISRETHDPIFVIS